jgi:hypothetical protein
MKNIYTIVLALFLAAAFVACKNSSSVNGPSENSKVSHPITSDTLTGNIRGTLLAGKTYYVKDSITVLAGDTLASQEGVTLYMLNNPTVFVQGNLIIEGTQSKQVYLTVLPSLQHGSSSKGAWGGLQCDSPNTVSIKWAHIDYTGGADAQGKSRQAIRFNANAANTSKLILEDSWVDYGADDGMKVYGGTGDIMRNTINSIGTTDGEAINIKLGFTGDIAYNVVWQPAGSCVKVETSSDVFTHITKVNVYNNTLVAAGFRRLEEFGYGVLVEAGAQANVFNNIFINNRYGFQIGQDADTLNVHYGNNLFFGTIDSLNRMSEFYPTDGVGRAQATDKISVDPQFKSFDGSPAGIIAEADNNDYHLNATSPALGVGSTNIMSLGKGDKDLGAYTTTGGTNHH